MSKHSESYSPRFRFEASTRGLFFCKKNATPWGWRSNYAHLTEISIRRGYHKLVKCDPGLPATKKQPRKTTSLPGPTTMLSSLNFFEITGPILRRPDRRVTKRSRSPEITASSKQRSSYPDTHPIRYHFSNLRHTILQRNLIHNHFRQRGEHRER